MALFPREKNAGEPVGILSCMGGGMGLSCRERLSGLRLFARLGYLIDGNLEVAKPR